MIGVAILTVSDSSAGGLREDISGPEIRRYCEQLNWRVVHAIVVGDNVDEISALLIAWADGGDVNLILTTGGTGIAARDVTPEATKSVLHRELPGFGELMRAEGRKKTKFSVLSRAVAGTRGATLIINLPGSPRGALDSLEALISVIPHAIDLLAGRTEHS